jgi:nucleotide-binding universal stress UspA family protein
MPEIDSMPATILAALDGSSCAQAAAGVAIQIAQHQNVSIRGLYVVDEALALSTYANHQAELGSGVQTTSHAELVTRFEEQGRAALEWLEARCVDADVLVTTDLLFGGVPELVLRAASRAKLLALGRRGHGHARDSNHLGRNFRAIAHRAQPPILVGGDEQRSVQRLLLFSEGSKRAQHVLTWASLLQRTLPAEVIVLVVKQSSDQSQQWLSEIQAHLDRSGLVNYLLVSREGQPASEIVVAATEYRVDLIVMGGYHRLALLEWLAGSPPDYVLGHIQLPVLIA